MFYREAGHFKTSYATDQGIFPIVQDRWFIAAVLVVAYGVVPFIANEYWFQAILIPFFVFSLAAIGSYTVIDRSMPLRVPGGNSRSTS